MAKRKKASFLIFTVTGFVLLGLVMWLISANEAKRLNRELPLGTLERMKHEVSKSIATDGTVSIKQYDTLINILIMLKDAPASDLTEEEFQVEYTAILKAIHNSEFQDFKMLMITSEAPFINKSGNTKPDIVAFAAFEKPTLDKVNWENFIHTNLGELTFTYEFHPIVERKP